MHPFHSAREKEETRVGDDRLSYLKGTNEKCESEISLVDVDLQGKRVSDSSTYKRWNLGACASKILDLQFPIAWKPIENREGKNKTVSHPDGRSRCRTLLVTVTEADEFADGKLEKTWLERAASARRPRGDQRRRNSDVGGAGGERYCFYLHRRGDGSWCTDVCGWYLGAARRGWLAGTAAQFPDVAVTPYHPACPPPESQ